MVFNKIFPEESESSFYFNFEHKHDQLLKSRYAG